MGFISDFRRWRLVQKGMSSGKKRRVRKDASFSARMDCSPWVRGTLYLLFCALVASIVYFFVLKFNPERVFRPSMYALTIAVSGIVTVEMNHAKVTKRNRWVLLLTGVLLLQLFLYGGISWFANYMGWTSELWIMMVPYVMGSMLLSVLLGASEGAFCAVYSCILGIVFLPPALAIKFLCLGLLSGLSAAWLLRDVRCRMDLWRAGIMSGLVVLVLGILLDAVGLREIETLGTLGGWKALGEGVAASLGMGIITTLIISGTLPILETIFDITTDISWLEQGDLNHELLRRVQLEAPGTFHHCLLVGSLSEAAAKEIGANAGMCRVSSYFHDIGKLKKPEYFIENLHAGQENPHDSLTPMMSAIVIKAHVKDGVDMAMEHHLNPRIIDVIREHHGDSLVSYFYRKAQEKKRDEELREGEEGDGSLPQVDEKDFRYPGPKPQSKESAIVSLADIVESASRSLQNPTPTKIHAMVHSLVEARVLDGQLDECDLTMKELATVKEVLAKTLISTMHSRIAYPSSEEGDGKKSNGNHAQKNKTNSLKSPENKQKKSSKPKSGEHVTI